MYPYSGFYNGNVKLMIANGTYADFRDKVVRRAEKGWYKPEQIEAWDKEWEDVPLEERLRRRNNVVEDSTPVEVIIQTPKGPIKTLKAKPDENNNVSVQKKNKKNVIVPKSKAKGALTNDNNPLLKNKPVSASLSE